MEFTPENYMLFPEEERLSLRKKHKFSQTNIIWNKYGFNQKKNVGSLMDLIRKSNSFTKSEWVDFYFKNGAEAKNKRIEIINERYAYEINREYDLRELARMSGKTVEDLMQIAYDFKAKLDIEIHDNDLSLNEVFNYVYIRVIDETFIGFAREREALRQLQIFCKPYNFNCEYSASEIDSLFGIDIEIKDEKEKLLMGIQVKSENVFLKYKDMDMGYEHSELMNDYVWQKEKHNKYFEKFGAPVNYLFLNNNYEIVEAKVFLEINKLKDIKAKEIKLLPTTVYFQFEGFVAAPVNRNPFFKNNDFFNQAPSALLNTMNEFVKKYGSDSSKIVIQSDNIEELNVKKAYILKHIPNFDIDNIVNVKPNQILSLCEKDKILFTCREETAIEWHKKGGKPVFYKKTTYPTELNSIDPNTTLKQIEERIDSCYKKTLDINSFEYKLKSATESVKENFIDSKQKEKQL